MGALIVKYLIIAILAVVLVGGYFINQSNKADAERLKQANAEIERKKQAEIQEKLLAEKKAQNKVNTDIKIKELQSIYMMDYLDAEKIVNSKEMSLDGKQFYADLGVRWSDALKVAGSTSRIALSEPVARMQGIKQDLIKRDPETACEARLKSDLLKSYDLAISGFLSFMAKNEAASDWLLESSSNNQKKANSLISYC